MAGAVAEITRLVDRHGLAIEISRLWDTWNNQRSSWMAEKAELREYLFATDTTKTSNSRQAWQNTTVTPKLTQIRDTLSANYLSATMPNDDWMMWEAHSQEAADAPKRQAIMSYMSNKVRECNFRTINAQLLLDYIDYGNVFATTEYANEVYTDPATGETSIGYIGPRPVRISPLDIVFNPTAARFEDAPKIVRSVKTMGELLRDMEDILEKESYEGITSKITTVRGKMGNYSSSDFNKSLGFNVDGFGDIYEYYQSGFVEVLEFEGDIYNQVTEKLERNQVITIVDRSIVIRHEKLPTWQGKSTIRHVGWRVRPDNLWAMGPLDNLVGLQYRIDFIENTKADMYEIMASPPLKVKGEVDPFVWQPHEEMYMDADADVEFLTPDVSFLSADMQIDVLMSRMEEMAGSPKQAAGHRTPGEKTAFEVQQLETAGGRLFKEKVIHYEINLQEKILNDMLELGKRHMDGSDLVRVMDDDLGVEEFSKVDKEDITARGKIVPVGARHFLAQSVRMSNLQQVSSTALWQSAAPHISGKAIAKMIEDDLTGKPGSLYKPFVALEEQAEGAAMMQQVQEQLTMEATAGLDDEGQEAPTGEPLPDETQQPVA